jgi:hypothetical protein
VALSHPGVPQLRQHILEAVQRVGRALLLPPLLPQPLLDVVEAVRLLQLGPLLADLESIVVNIAIS